MLSETSFPDWPTLPAFTRGLFKLRPLYLCPSLPPRIQIWTLVVSMIGQMSLRSTFLKSVHLFFSIWPINVFEKLSPNICCVLDPYLWPHKSAPLPSQRRCLKRWMSSDSIFTSFLTQTCFVFLLNCRANVKSSPPDKGEQYL